MSVVEQLVETIKGLSEEDQQKLLIIASAFRQGRSANGSRPITLGRFAHLGIRISADEIDAARRETWAGFPRETDGLGLSGS
jgi:hypothetical protein